MTLEEFSSAETPIFSHKQNTSIAHFEAAFIYISNDVFLSSSTYQQQTKFSAEDKENFDCKEFLFNNKTNFE